MGHKRPDVAGNRYAFLKLLGAGGSARESTTGTALVTRRNKEWKEARSADYVAPLAFAILHRPAWRRITIRLVFVERTFGVIRRAVAR